MELFDQVARYWSAICLLPLISLLCIEMRYQFRTRILNNFGRVISWHLALIGPFFAIFLIVRNISLFLLIWYLLPQRYIDILTLEIL